MGVVTKMDIAGDNGRDSIIYMMSGEQDDDAFEGDVIDGAWIDECPRKSIYTGTLRGLITTNGPLYMTLTPLKEPWIYNDIYASTDPEIECITGSLYDCLVENGGHLTKANIESFVSKLTTEEIDARVYGKFKHLIGRVYGSYDEEIHVVPKFYIPQSWPVWCGIDPHQRKPNAALWVAISPEEKFYIVNEVYCRQPIETFGKIVKDISEQYNTVATVIDTSSETMDWARRDTARTILQRVGVQTRLARKKNNKETGRLLIHQALEGRDESGKVEPYLYVFDTCKRARFEFMNYVYDDYRDPENRGVREEPKKINDDMMDILSYIVVERPKYKKSEILE